MKKPNPPRIVTISVLTTATIVVWIVLSVYRVLTEKPSPEVSSEILAPISPELDTATLHSLSSRVHFEEGETQLLIASPSPTIQEEPEEPIEEFTEEQSEATATPTISEEVPAI